MDLERATAALASAEAEEPLLAAAGPVEGTRALVIGAGALPVLCALIRRGAARAEELTLADRACPDPVELAIVPRVASLDDAARAIGLALRALLPCGRLVLQADRAGLERGIGAMMRAAGLMAAAPVETEGRVIYIAEKPMFGPIGTDVGGRT